jgi:hypothetical protein
MTDAKQDNLEESQTSKQQAVSALTHGFVQLLEPVIIECDERIQAVFKSQTELSDQLDQLEKGSYYLVIYWS